MRTVIIEINQLARIVVVQPQIRIGPIGVSARRITISQNLNLQRLFRNSEPPVSLSRDHV